MTPRANELGQAVGDPVPGWTPRRRPEPGPFHGRCCTVVPLAPEHAEELYGASHGPGADDLWTYLTGLPGPFEDAAALATAIERQVADPASESMAVLVDGRAEGLASFLRIDTANGSVEIGGILLGTRLRRTTAATEALYLMARHALDDLGYRRYEWKCDALNGPSRMAAERLGFTYEGTFRNAMVTKGRNRDTAWYSIIAEEWPALRSAHERWLDAANFDGAGRQRVGLRELVAVVRIPPERSDGGTGVPHSGTPGMIA
jgi:RimJ/RimL family protein N-acetyltransferase